MVQFVIRVALVALFLAPLPAAAQNASQDSGHNSPGQFDFYVLSLSWSPSFCAQAAARREGRSASLQCGARPYSFVVHGLWPQYDKGFPEYCQDPAPRLYRGIVSSMLDLMPAPHLIYNEWDKHGTCSGLSPRRLFRHRAQGARGGENPARIYRSERAACGHAGRGGRRLHQGQSRPVAKGHRGRLRQEAVDRGSALSGQGFVQGVQFHDCPEVAKRSCRRDQLVMPPVRGG